MIKKLYFIIFIIFSLVLFSCARGFNPNYYYNNTKSSIKDNSNTNNNAPPDLGGGDENLTPEEDPFDPSNGKDWNNDDYNGFTLDLDNMVIIASFDGKNRPSYRLEKRNNAWQSGNQINNEYYYYGADTTGGGVDIKSITYYVYKSKNPTYLPDSKYNQSTRLERFYFYRLTGKGMGIADTDNYLIAIDKKSKLVFAYAVPKVWKQFIAGTPKAPDEWGAVETGTETDINTGKDVSFSVDGIQYFYEYDPVGIVKSDGTIEIYQWCSDSIGNNSKYGPRVEGGKVDLTRAIATYGVAGRSPYMPIKVEEITKDNITIAAKSLKNINVKSREAIFGIMGSPKNNAWFTYTIGGVAYNNETGSGAIQKIENLDPASTSIIGEITLGETKNIAVNSQVDFSSKIVNEVKNIDKGATIELASRVDKYNKETGFADTAKFGQHGSGNMTTVSAPILKLKYDVDNEQFVVDTENSIMSNDSLSTTISSYPADFTLKRGETKDITIRYKWMKGNDTTNGEEFEITYTLTFESVQK